MALELVAVGEGCGEPGGDLGHGWLRIGIAACLGERAAAPSPHPAGLASSCARLGWSGRYWTVSKL